MSDISVVTLLSVSQEEAQRRIADTYAEDIRRIDKAISELPYIVTPDRRERLRRNSYLRKSGY